MKSNLSVDVYDRSEEDKVVLRWSRSFVIPAMSERLTNRNNMRVPVWRLDSKISTLGPGAERSLVLMNGKRMVVTGASVGKGGQYVVDIGAFPTIAMERVELLKNGGSVTYGTDAMAGFGTS